jgi:GNAT superfamily N-acetyltransferase
MASLALAILKEGDVEGLAEITSLYREAFPGNERKPAAFLQQAAARADYEVIHARSGAEFVGFAVLYRSLVHEVALLEYMAIAAAARGRGCGRELYAAIAARVEEPLLLEVESVLPGESGDALRRRRKEFYRRLGCLTVEGLAYSMPRVSDASPPPMDLMIEGFRGNAVPTTVLRTWLEDIYTGVYGRSASDPAIDRMLRPIGATAALI